MTGRLGAIVVALASLSGCQVHTVRYSYVLPLESQPDPARRELASACHHTCGRYDPSGGDRFLACLSLCPDATLVEGDACPALRASGHACYLWQRQYMEADALEILDATASVLGAVADVASVAQDVSRPSSSSRSSSSSSSTRAASTESHRLATPARASGSTSHQLARPSRP